MKAALKKIVHILADVPIVGLPVLWLLRIRRKMLSKTLINDCKSKVCSSKVQTTSMDLDYYEQIIKGFSMCLERHEIKIRELENELKKLEKR